ncbi:MAG: hypothetical protein ACXQT4_01025 [Methanotrichaceae archaeon]
MNLIGCKLILVKDLKLKNIALVTVCLLLLTSVSAAVTVQLQVFGNGNLVFSDYSGICALNATTGDLVWDYPGGGSSPAVADGMVFTVGGGKVYAFGDVNVMTEGIVS